MATFPWLPPLIQFADFSGDIVFYTEKLYTQFKNDLVNNSSLLLFGKQVKVSSELDSDNRHERFWHTITDPHNPAMTDIKHTRAEKIPWIKAVIDNVDKDGILVYKRVKNGDIRVHLFVPEKRFIVILTEKRNAFYFITAYHIDYTYKLNEYQKEYEKYK
jgi:hypothetical protein